MDSPRLSTVLIAFALIAAGVGGLAYLAVKLIFSGAPS